MEMLPEINGYRQKKNNKTKYMSEYIMKNIYKNIWWIARKI